MRKLKITIPLTIVTFCVLGAIGTTSAMAAFGITPGTFDGTVLDQNGNTFSQAGGHPYSATTGFKLNTVDNGSGLLVPDGSNLRNTSVEVPPGLLGDPNATPACSKAVFLQGLVGTCGDETQVGIANVELVLFGQAFTIANPIYNLESPRGQSAAFGFHAALVPVFVVPTIRSEGDYGLTVNVVNIDQSTGVTGVSLTFWGVPASPAHDSERGISILGTCGDGVSSPPCPSGAPMKPFLTNPVDCSHGPFVTAIRAESWTGATDASAFTSHDNAMDPIGVTRCDRVPFQPTVSSELTTGNTESPSGLDFELNIPDEGIKNPDGIAQAELRKAVVTLPKGVTVNPSSAEGLGVCTPTQYAKETFASDPGEGCPNQSKIGTVTIDTPLLDDQVGGSLFLAQQDDPTTKTAGAENPFDSLLGLYIVSKAPEHGVIVKLAGKVEPNPETGQIVTIFDDLPQLPFSNFHLHFREGGRAPLVSTPSCGVQTTKAKLTPWSAMASDDVATVTGASVITRGVGGGPCPSGGVLPFKPTFSAGSINNNAKSYSPFNMRLIRADGEQDMTRFSSILPPGVLGKLAGVSKCSEQEIASAKTKTGREEQTSPSCPANSQIGRILVGAGVGSVLTYVPGKVYLGGPFNGDPLSVVVITPAVAGPFDVGTVVTREALTLDPETAEVQVDGKASDPIPHILEGIPLKLRDLRVYVDRDSFIINPTSCDPSSAKATLFGSYLDVLNPNDDVPVSLSDRFQAANCSSLGFKPTLSINLKGGTKRGGHPALRAVLNARPRDANIGKATVTLPKSAFLDQSHIRTICTRVQFASKTCPSGAIYGFARGFTPLLDEPIEGPVYLRSSSHKLPDLVAALHGLVDVNVVGRIDSFKGGIRSSFETVPDAPVSKFILSMQGGKKGLVVNSRNLCAGKNRATANFVGQNGKPYDFKPVVKASCGKGRKGKR